MDRDDEILRQPHSDEVLVNGCDNVLGNRVLTNYCFPPTIDEKLVNNPGIDLGQGLRKLMNSIYQELQNSHGCRATRT